MEIWEVMEVQEIDALWKKFFFFKNNISEKLKKKRSLLWCVSGNEQLQKSIEKCQLKGKIIFCLSVFFIFLNSKFEIRFFVRPAICSALYLSLSHSLETYRYTRMYGKRLFIYTCFIENMFIRSFFFQIYEFFFNFLQKLGKKSFPLYFLRLNVS